MRTPLFTLFDFNVQGVLEKLQYYKRNDTNSETVYRSDNIRITDF